MVNWAGLTDGYREFRDPRPLIERLRSGRGLSACWEEVWERYHHQSDVGTASYAIVPAIVDAYASRPRTWEPYAYVAILEECREEKDNPDMPDWLEDDYDHALVRLRELAFEDLRAPQPTGRLAHLLSFLAAASGSLGLAVAIGNLEMNDYACDVLERYGEKLKDV